MRPSTCCVLLLALGGCGEGGSGDGNRDFRAAMRAFVGEISAYARARHPGFIIIPQNGTELVTDDGEAHGEPAADYLAAIDGLGREDLLYGYDADNEATPKDETERLQALLDVAAARGLRALVTDYCSSHVKVDDSYARNAAKGYLSFAASHRDLDNVPTYPATPYHAHAGGIKRLADAENFLYLLDPGPFASADALADTLAATSYDLFVIDAFFDGTEPLSTAQIAKLQRKGEGSRLLVAYMSIGEAEDYRAYWRSGWKSSPPSWLLAENPDWPGNYKVRYWDPAWKKVILGAGGYLDGILAQGFDGVYLDIIDAFEYFE